jgi:hypothetical protein
MSFDPPAGPPAPPAAGYGAPPPAGGYGLDANPYAPPQASFDDGLPMECPQANTALKYALVGLFCFGIVLGPLAIKNALDAKKLIALRPGMTGDGKATAALVIGIVDVALFFISMFARLANT